MLHAYFIFNVYFFKILFIHIFLASLVPKSEVLQINWNLVQAYIAIYCYMLIMIWIFSKFFVIYIFGGIFGPIIVLQNDWNIVIGTLLYAYYNFNVYFFKSFVIHIILDKFGLKIWSLPNSLKFGAGVHYHILITILMFIYSKVLSFI